ncbi:uncharacterized protein CTRU02_200389 [Colletotrichum truncatum]|uniref:Uncharacterized protein n=1 Tax=Colletotrichum truncatum TaxID=5467 RepID=A0ACC3ZEF0_COLTU|nr:uncharacterized protein CTRU02_00148 [Colletotrichum truncatum]KAF6801399.1 hypothetical protein CTRU02_00148 [Colletotrichum truncatum]
MEASVGREEPQAKDEQQVRDEAGSAKNDDSAGQGLVEVDGNAAPKTSDAAELCSIASIKLGADTDTSSSNGQLKPATHESSLEECAGELPGEHHECQAVKEQKLAGVMLNKTSSAVHGTTAQQNSLREQLEVAQLPPALVVQPYQPPVMGQPGWEKTPDRPPQKLPIRFKDCVGRNMMIPWRVAKSWPRVRNLIKSIFSNVDVLGPHVLAGHYDLFVHNVWVSGESAAVNPALMSFQHMASQTAESSSPSSSTNTAPPKPAAGASLPGSCSSMILPELWEDILEPGMLITMHMWPLNPPPPPPPPPPAPGVLVEMIPPPPPSPGWIPPRRPLRRMASPPPRRKTRKRQG